MTTNRDFPPLVQCNGHRDPEAFTGRSYFRFCEQCQPRITIHEDAVEFWGQSWPIPGHCKDLERVAMAYDALVMKAEERARVARVVLRWASQVLSEERAQRDSDLA